MILIVQILLVLAVAFVSLILIRGGSNAKHMAVRRMMVLLFAITAAMSIFFPTLLSSAANLLGIGRGTDLVLYAFIVSFLVYMSTTHQRFRHMEASITKLARRVALDEAPSPGRNGVNGPAQSATGILTEGEG